MTVEVHAAESQACMTAEAECARWSDVQCRGFGHTAALRDKHLWQMSGMCADALRLLLTWQACMTAEACCAQYPKSVFWVGHTAALQSSIEASSQGNAMHGAARLLCRIPFKKLTDDIAAADASTA